LLSLQTSLVFKRIQPSRFSKRSKKAIKEGETKAFHALISEISVLALAGQHPNISNLLGICWDVNEDRAAWPVLVFKKAPLGNMDEFARLNFDKARSWVTRVKLIAGIARAVEYMHAHSKVIHPNIPEYLLISFLQKSFTVILNHKTSWFLKTIEVT
jgi:serine/threonine protein kinase